jgi:pimeloyl-ACP methyl ester carboxylesterase
MKMLRKKNFYLLTLLYFLFAGCAKNTETPANLVPPTADQDQALPQIKIHVAGHDRSIHLQTFGDSANPPVFILPGGPGADFKLLLPLKALADTYYVIMWDSRGAGLSERVTREELSLESFDEEIAQVKAAMAPNRKATFIGHSFGGTVMAHYTANHPEEVQCLILIEPGKLDLSLSAQSNGGNINYLDGQDFFWQNELLTSKDHAAADYKALEVLPKSSRNWTCDNSIIQNYPMWRFGAYHYYMVQKNSYHLPKDYNWAKGIENFPGTITIIAGTCGALSENFQRETNLQTIPAASFKAIAGAGHISLFTDYANETLNAVRNALQ